MLELKSLIVKNKKGSIQDIFTLMIFMVGIGIFIAILIYTIPKITDGMRETELNDSVAIRTALLSSDEIVQNNLNNVYLILFAGLIISLMIASFMIDSHPIFVPVYIFLLAFAIVVGVILDNVYEEFTTNTIMNESVTNYMPIPTAIMGNIIPILIAVGVLSMIIIFGKRKMFGERL